MARTRQQEQVNKWSCPLCTLLNTQEKDRCAACNNARPRAHQPRKSQPLDPSTAAATASEAQQVNRPASGASLPRNQGNSVIDAMWRQKPRLVVTKSRGNQLQNVVTDAEKKVEREQVETGTIEQNTDSTATEKGGKLDTEDVEEWSCPLCTLLNTPKDDRCAACDNVRPPAHQLRKSQSLDPSTASEAQNVNYPASGKFFSSFPRKQGDSGVDATKPSLVRNVATEVEKKVEKEQIGTSTTEQNADSIATEKGGKLETKVESHVVNSTDTVPVVTMEKEEESQQEEEEDTGMDVEEPCFNLLGSGASVFAAPLVKDTVDKQCAADETKSRDGSGGVGADNDMDVVSSPPEYQGFMPASKVLIEESTIEEKLASAGLDLSESEDDEPKRLRRRNEEKDEGGEDKWVCQICTNLNDQTAMECSSCNCKRYKDPPTTTEPNAGPNLRWACNICTNLNPPDATRCLMCLSARKSDFKTSNGASGERWKCSLCATFNTSGTTRCEVCDRPREDAPKKATEKKGPQCSVCTNINFPGSTRCELCDSSLRTGEEVPITGSNLRWACGICTNLNPPDATGCNLCLSARKSDSRTSNGASSERWKCSLCATFNAPGTTRCEVCDRSREDEPKKSAEKKGPQCSVCTNINFPGSTRCELCDSSLRTDEEVPDDQFVDLSSSPQNRKSSYDFDDDELENPYADLSQYNNDYDPTNEVADADPDYVEEISDNEQPSKSLTNPRPVTVRSDLKEFYHFVCMEDLRRDYGCRINFSKMFAGQRSHKSYSDRLATRKAQSRKRKRRTEAGEVPTSTSRRGKKAKGGKAANGGKKRKATAAPRRASAGGAKAPRGKRARKTGTTARRASSATTYSPGINHYDDSGDFGEDLNTMAWEGVGSAGYL